MKTVMARGLATWLAISALAFGAAAEENARSITVTGEGRVTAVPDMAILNLGVMAQAPRAQDAMAEVSEGTQRIFDAMPALRIEPTDVQTSALSLNPIWERRQTDEQGEAPRIAGYRAETRLTVRVRDIAQVGPVMEATLGAGGNLFQGLSFAIAEPGALERQARERAVIDARSRAATYAGAAGVSLGEVLSISETGGAVPGPMTMGLAEARAVPIAPGETEITATVIMRFALE